MMTIIIITIIIIMIIINYSPLQTSSSYILEILPSQFSTIDATSHRPHRVEKVLHLHLSTLQCPVQSAGLQSYIPGCTQGEHRILPHLIILGTAILSQDLFVFTHTAIEQYDAVDGALR